jgi:hypothetical protein
MHRATYFSDVVGFRSVHAATLLVFGYLLLYLSGSPVPNFGSDECGPELGFATGRWGQLTYGYVALWWSRLFC